jgi:ATP/maltotriose-dependent transcriptional regulator MalT
MRQPARKRTGRANRPHRLALPAKLTRPEVQAIVPRPRIYQRLDGPEVCRWAWIAAPAGAGKTTLAASWVEARGPLCLWVSLDAGDADPATFFHYLGLAGTQRPGRKRAQLPALTPEFVPGLEIFARRFFERLFALYPERFAVVLDNCHEVPPAAPLVEVLLGALIDSLPAHGRLLCLSRSPLPAALVRRSAQPGFLGFDWEDLSFTDEEAIALASIAAPRAVPAAAACNRWLKGWAAGLKLVLRALPEEVDRLLATGAVTRERLFDYFAEEVFKRSSPMRRDFLLRCAVLPDMEGETAAAAAGRPDADRALAELYAERLFIERRSLATGLSYRFHPLFRDFLRARLVQEIGPADRVALETRAAAMLEARGDLEAATAIALQAGDAELLARLILRQAETLFAQGRLLTLEQWIASLPESVRAPSGWLLYWFGVSLSLREPARGRLILEQAYERFQESAQTIGAWLAAGGIIYSYFILWGTEPERAAHWIGVFQTLQERSGGTIPPSIELQVISLLGHFASHCPEHPVSRHLVERARTLAPGLSDPVQRCAIGSIAVGFLMWQGDETAARSLIEELRRGRDEDASATLGSLVFDIWCGILLWAGGDYAQSLEWLAAARQQCRNSGLRIYEWHCVVHMAMSALGAGDLELAGKLIAESHQALTPHHIIVSHMTRALQAQYLAFCGQFGPAATLARRIRADSDLLREAPSTAAFIESFLCSALLESGALDEAAECARCALEHASRLPSDRWMFEGEMLLAGIELERGAEEATLARLRCALEIAARRDFRGGLSLYQRERTAKLLALALREGIQTEQARRLIRRCRLPVPGDAQTAAVWPVRLRISALGDFAVQIDEQPLDRSQRAARKPLEVLKYLVGVGAGEVSLDALQAALWPDLEGDAARNAAHVSIYRLRRLLGDDSAVLVQGTTIGLNTSHAWVDVEAFRRLSAHLQSSLAAGIRSRADAERMSHELLSGYPGHFLPAEEHPWAVGVRERLRSRFMHGANALSAVLERLGATEEALALNRHGADLDPHAETFHRGIIRALLALGRHAEALEAFRTCRELLRARLGVDPSTETERLVRHLRARP